ncbi:MAG: hypothetical protein QM722_18975 [Piscinibacter sp.]
MTPFRHLVRLLSGLVAALAFVAAGPALAGDHGHRHELKPGRVLIDGDVARRLVVDAADLAKLPQQALTLSFLSGSGYQTHTYTGPLLIDVLALAKPDFDAAVKGDKLRHYVVVTGSDGYRAVVAWGEFDPEFAAKQVVLAITEDGASLADVGPRLLVPGDLRGGRYVSEVVSIRLGPADRGRD